MKRFFAFLLAVTLVFAFAACGKNGDEATEPTATAPQIDPLPYAYASILNSLLDAFPWDDGEDPICAAYPQLSELYRDHAEATQIGFALIDLDQNDQEELVILTVDQGYVYDLFTIVNEQAVHLFSGDIWSSVTLREGGHIEIGQAGTDGVNKIDFYQLAEGQPTLLAHFTAEQPDSEEQLSQYRDEYGILSPEPICLGDFMATGIPSGSSPLYAMTKTEDGYYITFSDEAGNVIYEDPCADREPRVTRLSSAIYELLSQTGTAISTNWAVYCNAKTGEVSHIFQFVLAATEEYVVYVTQEEGAAYVIVEGSFDRDLYQEKLPLAGVSAVEEFIVSCVFDEDGNAVVTYLAGEEHTPTQLSFPMPQ